MHADVAVDYNEPGWTEAVGEVTVALDGVGGELGRGALERLGRRRPPDRLRRRLRRADPVRRRRPLPPRHHRLRRDRPAHPQPPRRHPRARGARTGGRRRRHAHARAHIASRSPKPPPPTPRSRTARRSAKSCWHPDVRVCSCHATAERQDRQGSTGVPRTGRGGTCGARGRGARAHAGGRRVDAPRRPPAGAGGCRGRRRGAADRLADGRRADEPAAADAADRHADRARHRRLRQGPAQRGADRRRRGGRGQAPAVG